MRICGVWGSAPHGAKTMGGVSLDNSKAHANCVYKIVSDRQQRLILVDIRCPVGESCQQLSKFQFPTRQNNQQRVRAMSEAEMRVDPARASVLASQLQSVNERIAAAAQGRAVSLVRKTQRRRCAPLTHYPGRSG